MKQTHQLISGDFLYLVISQTKRTAQIGTCEDTSKVPNLKNGVVPSVADTMTICHIPRFIEDYRVIWLGYRAIAGLPKLRVIYIPKTLEQCRGDAFAYNPLLEEVIFEENSHLTTLSFFVFRQSPNIKRVILPKSVNQIGVYAFADMNSLESIYIHSFLHLSNDITNAFNNTNTDNLKIYVPSNYPYSEFAGVIVLPVLSPFIQITKLKIQKKIFFPFHTLIYNIIFCGSQNSQ